MARMTPKKSIVLGGLVVVLAAATAYGQDWNMAGVQMWNCEYWQTVCIGDFYGPNYELRKLKPINLVGARNGTFSGWVVLTASNGPLRGLRATAGELVHQEGGGVKIPADLVKVRYPEQARPDHSYAPPYRFDRLADQPPEELAPVDPTKFQQYKPKNEGPVAMQPVWVTVRVPKDAAAGDYDGQLAVETEDPAIKPMKVAIRLKVHDWQLPDAKDFTIQNLGYMSPERVAQCYGVPLWSDRHFELMGKSLELMLELGSRQATVNLVCRYPAQDNAESMVRWIKQSDGSFKYDFTIVEKYLDLCGQKIGKPFPIRLNIWSAPRKDPPQLPQVNVLDPATGKLDVMDQPPYGTPESLAFWKPVLDELRARLEKRGWFDSVVVNWINYCGTPDPPTVDVLYKIWPDGKWSSMDHGRRTRFDTTTKGVFMPVPVSLAVWSEGDLRIYEKWTNESPGPRGFKGRFKPGQAICGHARGRHREWSVLWVPRVLCEELIMRGCNGIDPLGGDLWPAKDSRGRYSYGIWTAFALGPGNAVKAYLAPGPNGAVATERFEALREGVQMCEAMLFLQRALDDGKISGALADKANRVLDERARHFMSAYKVISKEGHRALDPVAVAQGAQEREGELFAAAAEVAKALAVAKAGP